MQQKILIVYRTILDKPYNLGIRSKLNGIRVAYEQHGFKVFTVHLSIKGLVVDGNLVNPSKPLSNRFSLYSYYRRQYYCDLLKLILKISPNFIHYRNYLKNNHTKKFFISIKANLPSTKVFLELPTFPYDFEQKGLFRRILLIVDQKINNKLPGCIDFIIHYGHEKVLWGIPVINIQNGVELKYKTTLEKYKKLTFVAVGKLWIWWGLDLFIRSMQEYNSAFSNKIYLEIIGNGPERSNIDALVDEYELNNYVKLHGPLSGRTYDEIMRKCHIGIGVLAMHRKNMNYSSALKHREYASYGLPFIYRGFDNDFDQAGLYRLEQNEPINIDSVLSYYFEEYDYREISKYLFKLVESRLTWREQLKPVIKTLTSGKLG